jgi:hypothetical protein
MTDNVELDPVAPVDPVAPPTGVRSPATLEIDLNTPESVLGATVVPGTPVPPQVPVPSPQPETVRTNRYAPVTPSVPASVQTRDPLVPLVALDQVHPSTIEAATALQHIPNDQIQAVYEDANGVKRDALGHVFTPDPTAPFVPPTTGPGFE